MNNAITPRSGTPAPEPIREALRVQVSRLGTVGVARLSGVSPEAVARIVGGLPVRRGTVALTRCWLEALRLQEARLTQAEFLARGQEGEP